MNSVTPLPRLNASSRALRPSSNCSATLSPSIGLHRRPRTVRRQLQHRRRPASALLPVRHLRLQHLAAHPAPLPHRIVRILDRQAAQADPPSPPQRPRTARSAPAPARPSTSRPRRCGASSPAARAPPRQARSAGSAPEDRASRSNGFRRLLPRQRLQLPLGLAVPAQIVNPQRQPLRRRTDPLHRLPVHHREGRPQHLVPRHDAIQGAAPAPPCPAARAAAAPPACDRPGSPPPSGTGTTTAAAQTTAAAPRFSSAAPIAGNSLGPSLRHLARPTPAASAARTGSPAQAPHQASAGSARSARIASSEWPPSSKKLSWRPTRSTPSSSCQIAASACSISPSGASYAPRAYASPSGAGNAFRSSFPFGVSGSASSATYAAGTMYSRQRLLHMLPQPCASTPLSAPAASV